SISDDSWLNRPEFRNPSRIDRTPVSMGSASDSSSAPRVRASCVAASADWGGSAASDNIVAMAASAPHDTQAQNRTGLQSLLPSQRHAPVVFCLRRQDDLRLEESSKNAVACSSPGR